MSEDDILAYLSGELDAAGRREFEARLEREPALRDELQAWLQLAEARQFAHNAEKQDARDAAFLREVEGLAQSLAQPNAAVQAGEGFWRRLLRWIWPRPVSPLLPLGWLAAAAMSLLVLQLRTVGLETASVAVRGGQGSCPRMLVDLPDTVTARQLRETLAQYSVAVTAGPDQDGRFTWTAARDTSLADAAKALGATAVTALEPSVCAKP